MSMEMAMVGLFRSRMGDLLGRATRAIEQMSDDQINGRPNDESNSVANLVFHLEGNLQHFVEATIGGDESRRNRDREFNSREKLTRAQAIERLSGAVSRADAVLAGLSLERLEESVPFVGRQVSVLELLLILTVHLGEHVGQILYIAKAQRGAGFMPVSFGHKKQS